ncbi:hypothetical protein DL766_006874 [Monosporascus sp. MC13-8B]|uniref:Uncharacterized protein n=1 Tax=Monosporascus cannonballus TaxID=155416 RepID=A0ABY0GX52_9PEZI|nr:hypothetical protein DL762_008166 [Monosporascus cannonballus]RYO82687.1 hypothetical protein DL763_008142 [Monosporascus cannonballus]RYP25992.1 hypothetical protein DL766_006874 [Monosporascus sp. MC13-8B]
MFDERMGRHGEYRERSYQRNRGSNPGRDRESTNGWRNRGDQCHTSTSSLDLGLRPRSFAELTDERMLLLDELQRHDEDARDLFARLAAADERVSDSKTFEERGHGQRHRGYLRRRVGDAVDEERQILLRLGELSVEIQCRERWCQVRRDREAEFSGRTGPPSRYSYWNYYPPPPPSLAPPSWPPAAAFGAPGDGLQCNGAGQFQRAFPPFQTDAPDGFSQPPNPVYSLYRTVPQQCSGNVWEAVKWPADRSSLQNSSQKLTREGLISPESTMTRGLGRRRNSLP